MTTTKAPVTQAPVTQAPVTQSPVVSSSNNPQGGSGTFSSGETHGHMDSAASSNTFSSGSSAHGHMDSAVPSNTNTGSSGGTISGGGAPSGGVPMGGAVSGGSYYGKNVVFVLFKAILLPIFQYDYNINLGCQDISTCA